jgi:nucleotide-binding universal stress UspA family protein
MKILLAIDDSPGSRAAVESVMSEFRPEHCMVRVLHVDDWPKDLPTELAFAQGQEGADAVLATHEHRRQRADELLAGTKHRLEAARFGVVTEIRVGDARREILHSAAEWHPDLIVVGSHGRQGLERFLLGSVSESVVRHATCSVDVVRPASQPVD